MKRKSWLALNKVFFAGTVLMALCFFSGCEKDKSEAGTKRDKLRDAYETIVEANAVKQAAMYDAIEVLSNNYTQKLFTHDLTYEQADAMLSAFAEAAEYSEDVDKALSVIEETKKKSTLYQNEARLKSTMGIGSALRGFYNWVSGAGERSRERILTVASNIPEHERTELYNSLRDEWKGQASSESDFWNKLEQGEFDNQASQMYNDFYHNAETTFPDMAQEKGLTIQKIVTREGAEGVEAGAQVIIETTKLATLLGEGMDMVEKAQELAEKAELIVTDPKGAVVEEIKGQIASRLGEYIDVDGLIDGAELGEETGEAIKILLDATLGSDDPEDWIKDAIDWGATKIMDGDENGDKADIVIAENKNEDTDGQPAIIIGVNPPSDDVNDGIDLVLPQGEWEVDVIDEDGYLDQLITYVSENVLSVILATTDKSHSNQDNSYSLSAWVSPGNPAAYESVTVYALISPKEAGVDIYFEISGTDGYSDSGTYATDASGQCSFYVPGGAEEVTDVITVKIVETGLTRTLTYVF
ncbi:MAG: hypothetical protein JXR41_11235 [Bacteroidales bacterium]|nr:hypothetical protein [Bacteroidales bacterium]